MLAFSVGQYNYVQTFISQFTQCHKADSLYWLFTSFIETDLSLDVSVIKCVMNGASDHFTIKPFLCINSDAVDSHRLWNVREKSTVPVTLITGSFFTVHDTVACTSPETTASKTTLSLKNNSLSIGGFSSSVTLATKSKKHIILNG